jgi:hypothetical protein
MAGKKMSKTTPGAIVTSPGRIGTSVRAFFGDITGRPPSIEAYADSDPPGHTDTATMLRRPKGGGTGASISTIAKGGKGSKGK